MKRNWRLILASPTVSSFPGFTDNPWAWIAKAELFVLPSRWEGFPSVVAETLACAAPALVTACDFGPREVVEHGRSGWVVPPDDVGAFGAAMDMLLRRPDLTQQFRRNGPARAAGFGIDEMIEAYTDLFLEQAEAGLVPATPRARPRRSAIWPRTATSG